MEKIHYSVMRDHNVLEKAILVLYSLQTKEERLDGKAQESNRKGFDIVDSKKMSYYAELIKNNVPKWKEHIVDARDRMKKYCRQLSKIPKIEYLLFQFPL